MHFISKVPQRSHKNEEKKLRFHQNNFGTPGMDIVYINLTGGRRRRKQARKPQSYAKGSRQKKKRIFYGQADRKG